MTSQRYNLTSVLPESPPIRQLLFFSNVFARIHPAVCGPAPAGLGLSLRIEASRDGILEDEYQSCFGIWVRWARKLALDARRVQQGLKPNAHFQQFAARLKSCPVTGPQRVGHFDPLPQQS